MKTEIENFQIVQYNCMDEESKIYLEKINKRIEEIALILKKHENKNDCTTPNKIDIIKIQYNDYEFFIAPSFLFKELIIDYGYINAADQYQRCFGKNDDQCILTALQTYLKFKKIDAENLNKETMAYLFQIVNGEISDKVLRIDLYREIKDSKFIGGIFHLLKHFTIEGFDTISNSKKGTTLENFRCILFNIISNFYLPEKQQKDTEKNNNYISYSYFDEKKILKGVYYKEDNLPVYFINTMYVENSK